jgi:integrase
MATTTRRRKALISYEYGTRVYAPTPSDPRYRVVSTDADGQRVHYKCSTEEAARRRAREYEVRVAEAVILPGRVSAPVTVGELIDRYLLSLGSRSIRYAERQEYLLRKWVEPALAARPLMAWTPSDSEQILDHARQSLAPATVQNIGAAMRAMVTFAFKNRWLPRDSDPMWLVKYRPHADVQGQAIGFVPRARLPTDEECAALFAALERNGHHQWSVAMALKHRSGVRWGELAALRPSDIDFEETRVVRIERAVEESSKGLHVKTTKNRQRRVTTFPASLTAPLREWTTARERLVGPDGLLFPAGDGGFARRRAFQRVFARAAKDAEWPMKRPTASIWHPHHLRHVAACWLLFDVKLDAAAVSMLLGHANAAFTLSRYVGVRGDLLAAATAATDAW